jgi:hypothetical protein
LALPVDKTFVLKLEKPDEEQLIGLELEILKSLTVQQSFEMLEEKSQFIKSFLHKNDDSKIITIIKRT